MSVNEAQPSAHDEKQTVTVSPEPCRPFFNEPDIIFTALERAQIGIWTWNAATDRANWSTNVAAIHGSPTEFFGPTLSALEGAIHPEDRLAAIAALRDASQPRTTRRLQYRLHPPTRNGAMLGRNFGHLNPGGRRPRLTAMRQPRRHP